MSAIHSMGDSEKSDSHIIHITDDKSCNALIDHSHQVAEDISDLFEQEEYSDLVLIVDNNRFPVHKIILACRSQYFKALLYGGLAETHKPEIELKDISSLAFRYILMYIYRGVLDMSDMKEETILDVLSLAQQYNFSSLETPISNYLRSIFNSSNITQIYNIAIFYSLESLIFYCLEFMDTHADDVLKQENFCNISIPGMERLLSRDSFCVMEIDIFNAVHEYIRSLPVSEQSTAMEKICPHIRLPLMQSEELLGPVRQSEMFTSDALLDAFQIKNNAVVLENQYRGLKIPDENMASLKYKASVIRGDIPQNRGECDSRHYDADNLFANHSIKHPGGEIVVRLERPSILNTIRFHLLDKDTERSYSYYIAVSVDQSDWTTIIDMRGFHCRSAQELHFKEQVVRYIKIVGTFCSNNPIFHIVSFECFYTKKPFMCYKGIELPRDNICTVEKCANVIQGVSRTRNALINGEYMRYDWDSGYTCHQLGSGCIVIQLPQPFYICTMRFLLWDLDERYYSYTVEVSTDNATWDMVCDRSNISCRSWQIVTFPMKAFTFIKIVGTHNTVNEVFHVVHFECPYKNEFMDEEIGKLKASGDLVSNKC